MEKISRVTTDRSEDAIGGVVKIHARPKTHRVSNFWHRI